ncbi:hypothetical protein CYMTET_18917 [Cymbomonas tetramitiformis]|uniref:F-box domain-containing protein n=1 Tax=Cymbomonas tetramitiformis TaxID=36881 RepID=A0AAE0G7H5_9CHLO|nr:hypothetical protein CYMTET_18917 [Cymbomonas tetramitiformis]
MGGIALEYFVRSRACDAMGWAWRGSARLALRSPVFGIITPRPSAPGEIRTLRRCSQCRSARRVRHLNAAMSGKVQADGNSKKGAAKRTPGSPAKKRSGAAAKAGAKWLAKAGGKAGRRATPKTPRDGISRGGQSGEGPSSGDKLPELEWANPFHKATSDKSDVLWTASGTDVKLPSIFHSKRAAQLEGSDVPDFLLPSGELAGPREVGMADLDREMLSEIFSHLDGRSLVVSSAVCREWRAVAVESAIWHYAQVQWEQTVVEEAKEKLHQATLRRREQMHAKRRALVLEIRVEEERKMEEKMKRDVARRQRKKNEAKLLEAAFDGQLDTIKQLGGFSPSRCGWANGERSDGEMWCRCAKRPRQGVDLECMNKDEQTPLSEAAVGGRVEVLQFLLMHGVSIDDRDKYGRTPVYRSVFMGYPEAAELLMSYGASPLLESNDLSMPLDVTSNPETKDMLRAWDGGAHCLRAPLLDEQRQELFHSVVDDSEAVEEEQQYFTRTLVRGLDKALDTTMASDRYTVLCDLNGAASMFLRYRDTNYLMAYHPGDMRRENKRKGLIGALRWGKPFVLDLLDMEIDFVQVQSLLDDVQPGLLEKILCRHILREEVYMSLVTEDDPDSYRAHLWERERTAMFHLVIITKLPEPLTELASRMYVVMCA